MAKHKLYSTGIPRLFLAGLTSLGLLGSLAGLGLSSPLTAAQAKELTLYTARHYSSDDALYAAFTRQTGIKIGRASCRERV